jgi:hypothetical protein
VIFFDNISVNSPGHPPVDDRPRGRGAFLPCTHHGAVDDVHQGVVHIGVGQHDRRVLTAELELDLRAAFPGEFAEAGADFVRAGETDGHHPFVVHQGISDRACPSRHQVQDAGRQTSFGQGFDEPDGAERRLARGLEDDGVAECQRRARSSRPGSRSGSSRG